LPLKKKISNFFAPEHLAEVQNLVGSKEKKIQNFLPYHSCLRWKIWLALGKKFHNFPHCQSYLGQKICSDLDNFLFSLRKIKSKFFHTNLGG
jgi:hypothetical protein